MQKILIVDDEIMMLKMASRILSKKYKVICASSGAEALQLFENEKPDMILSDLLMPEMDGYELYRLLQTKTASPVPVMFMTADDSDESENRGFAIGAADYIRKPLKADILLRRVSNILDNLDKLQDLKQAAELDSMTGLLNKVAAQREIGKLCEKARGVLLMIDLDNFKLVNDFHGHAMGDKILIKFSELLNGAVDSADLTGRIGGDEFIAFCQNVTTEAEISGKANLLNEKIIAAAKNYMGDDMKIPLGVSIGAVFVPNEGRNFADLYQKADKALYEAKQNGKHGCIFYGAKNDLSAQKNSPDIQKILDERNNATEAYFVGADDFKIIYRLAARLVQSYKNEIQFMTLTIDSDDEKILGEFRDLLTNTFRISDCVTQNGKNQFLILMPETKMLEAKIFQGKIIAKVAGVKSLSQYKISCEIRKL